MRSSSIATALGVADLHRSCHHGRVSRPPNDDAATTHARDRGGDEAAVRAAILTVAALQVVDYLSDQAVSNPSYVAWRMLNQFLEFWKQHYPSNGDVQNASFTLKDDIDEDGSLFVDCDLFDEYYVRLPLMQPFTSDADSSTLLTGYFSVCVPFFYRCWSQVCARVEVELTRDDLLSLEEFDQLVQFLAPPDRLSELVPALDWYFSSTVPFGVAASGEMPGIASLEVIKSWHDTLQTRGSSLPRTGQLATRHNLLINELGLMATVARASLRIYLEVDKLPSLDAEESALAKVFNDALLSMPRVMAAEHLAYVRNRRARRAGDLASAFNHYSEACRLAHFAFNVSGTPRYAKYLAQNLLEISRLTGDLAYRRLAEIAWVDAYIMPYIAGLTSDGVEPFISLGWTEPVYASKARYSSIPSYSAEPDFLYTGAAAEFLRGTHPSFPPDAWAAAVLLTQHLKDVVRPSLNIQPDYGLAIFAPSGDGEALFPMRDQHPVAWLLYLTEKLVVEHEEFRHPHAGLHSSRDPGFDYRRWLGGEVSDTFRGAVITANLANLRVFPNVAKNLLRCDDGPEAENGNQALIWPHVASLWDVSDAI